MLGKCGRGGNVACANYAEAVSSRYLGMTEGAGGEAGGALVEQGKAVRMTQRLELLGKLPDRAKVRHMSNYRGSDSRCIKHKNCVLSATHAERKALFLEADRRVVELARRWYEDNDPSVLPRGITTFEAFENTMTLDIAMGGRRTPSFPTCSRRRIRPRSNSPWWISTGCSRRVPHLCKAVARSTHQSEEGGVSRDDIRSTLGILEWTRSLQMSQIFQAASFASPMS